MNNKIASKNTSHEVVTRTLVQERSNYLEYKSNLRHDFFHTCAYCTMSEAEAQAIRFTIDHYEPRGSRPDLVNTYSNLMYVCEECNTRKGDRCPPPGARAKGFRFFRPDEDVRSEHFEPSGQRIKHITATGDYSIEALDLNRLSLRKLRDIRARLFECEKGVTDGIMALRSVGIDQLPVSVRTKAHSAIRNTISIRDNISNQIDDLLREFAKSPLLDVNNDPSEATRLDERTRRLKAMEVLSPGNWRAPRQQRRNG